MRKLVIPAAICAATLTISLVQSGHARQGPPTAKIEVSLPEVYEGETFTARWSATKADSCDLSSSHFQGGQRPPSGEEYLGPVRSQPGDVIQVRVRCRNGAGSDTATATTKTVPLRPHDSAGVFDLGCAYSHSLPDDPIAFPDKPGRAHLHDFFGSKATNAFVDFDFLRPLADDPANTTCSEVGAKGGGGEPKPMKGNGSAYWFPALFKGNTKIDAVHLHVYYRNDSGGMKPAQTFPPGFKLIAGPFAGPRQGGDLTWFCVSPSDGGRARWDGLNPNCVGERTIHAMFSFPACWDGRLDSPDHRSHVSYGDGRGCPATHTLKLPRLLAIVHYRLEDRLTAKDLDADWHLAVQPDGQRQQLREFHGDYLFAWDPFRLDNLTHFCLNVRIDCKRNPPK